MSVFVGRTDTASYCTTFTQGISNTESYHTICILSSFRKFRQEFTDYGKTVTSVEVVSIDYGKRFTDHFLTHQHCMVCTPWFYTFSRTSKSFRKLVDALKYYFYWNMVFVLADDFLTEIFFKIFSDYEYNLSKSATDSIKNGIVHNCFTIGSQTVKLFQTSITTSHSGSQNKQSWFHNISFKIKL